VSYSEDGPLHVISNNLLRSCITDYFPTWRVSFVRKACDWLNFLAIFVVGWGWYEFETNDVGLTEGIRRIWKA
jgi:succinate dehydrogenase (ubiquinone) membrane anchor subunit